MGKYLNVDLNGNPLNARGKASSLISSGATVIPEPKSLEDYPDQAVLCVVENGIFDAAAWAYSQSELEEFKRPDGRNKTWLAVNDEIVIVGSLVD